ncbi:MAG: aminopeptidase P family protein [Gammaproteobacteria bacterium]|nr:aminopeptidase P family protein [Gammaproteobacteria bacterium]
MYEIPIFDENEFLQRCKSFQAMMADEKIDLLILDQPETIFHLLGYAMSEGFYQFCLLTPVGQPVMILRTVDAGTCKEYSWISDVIGFRDWDDPIEIALKQIKTRNWNSRRVGMDKNSYSLTVQRYSSWKTALSGSEFNDISTFIAERKAIKSPKEIEYLRKASDIADKTLQVIQERIKPGHSARDCVAISAESIISLGGDASVVGPVTRSIDDTKMHALVDDYPLQPGDTLHVELIPQYLGYSARLMRPVL